MQKNIGYQEVLTLTMSALQSLPKGQFEELARRVFADAQRRDLVGAYDGSVMVGGRTVAGAQVAEHVREAMWDCLLKRIIVFGRDNSNPEWPFYRVTDHGRSVLADLSRPQPYDPDGFLRFFDSTCPKADPAVRSYLAEAVQAFNASCVRSSAVMIGCGSEKLLLLLAETFESAIAEPVSRAKFAKEMDSKRGIHFKFGVLRDHLDGLSTAKKLPYHLTETVASELPSGFEMIRRCRNAAGHPDVPENVTSDTVFLNLRSFIEYARRMQELIDHFASNTVAL